MIKTFLESQQKKTKITVNNPAPITQHITPPVQLTNPIPIPTPRSVIPVATQYNPPNLNFMPATMMTNDNYLYPQHRIGPQTNNAPIKSTIALCPICRQVIYDIASAAIYNNQLLHEQCLFYLVQGSIHGPGPGSQQLPPVNMQPVPVPAPAPTPTFKIVVQPVGYQIANYNIFPAPVISIEGRVTDPFRACLIDAATGTVIQGAFKAGDVQAILHGSKSTEFSGLKLARMSVLKKAVCANGLRPKERDFAIQFSCGPSTWVSDKFNIVSSYAQLPPAFQVQRPYKRSKRRKETEETPETSTTTTTTTEEGPEQEEKNYGQEKVQLNPEEPTLSEVPTPQEKT